MSEQSLLEARADGDRLTLAGVGAWTAVQAGALERLIEAQSAAPQGPRRVTIDMFVALMAWHDDNHLEQLTRAVEGRP